MNTQNCAQCSRSNPEYTLRFVGVNVHSTSSVQYSGRKKITTTTTTESIAGCEKASFCDQCIRQKRFLNALGSGFGMLFGMFIFVMIFAAFFGGKGFNENAGTVAGIAAALGVVSAIIAFMVGMHKEAPFIAAQLLKKTKGSAASGVVYVPVESHLYLGKNKTAPDLEIFKSKTGLKTNVASMVFVCFIATGSGNQLVDMMLLQKQNDGAKEISAPQDVIAANTVLPQGVNTCAPEAAASNETDAVPFQEANAADEPDAVLFREANAADDVPPGAADAGPEVSDPFPAAAESKPEMKGWVFSCYDRDRVQAMSMFQNANHFYSENNILSMVRSWMKLPETDVSLKYISAPDWNAPDVRATENSFDGNIDTIYAQAINHLINRNICSRVRAVSAIKQNMPYPKQGLLLLVFLTADD